MNCFECGSAMKTSRENHAYGECGLDNFVLVDVEVRTCNDCGEREVVIPNIEGLHQAIAERVATSEENLSGTEVRFLRKYLGLSQVDLGKTMGVEPETVSRWEHGHPIGSTAERLLRLLALNEKPKDDYRMDFLRSIRKATSPSTVEMSVDGTRWQAVAC